MPSPPRTQFIFPLLGEGERDGGQKGRGNINVVLDEENDERSHFDIVSLFRTLNIGCVFHFQSFNEELFKFLLDIIVLR